MIDIMKSLCTYVVFNRLVIFCIAFTCLILAGHVKPTARQGDSPAFNIYQGDHIYQYTQPRSKLLSMWSVWDTKWYVSIAEDGYSTQTQPYRQIENRGFLPVYPILLWFFGTFLFFGNIHLAGVVLSNTFLILALIYIRKLVTAEPKINNQSEIKDVWWYILLFPTSYYLSAIYPESLFLLLSILVFYFAHKKKFFWSTLLFGVAALTKTFGIFLIIPIVFEMWKHRSYIPLRKLIGYILTASLLPAIYCLYMYQLGGDPFVYIHIQEQFFRHSWKEPIHTIIEGLYGMRFSDLWNCLYIFFGLTILTLARKKIPASYTVYALVYILFTPTTGVLEGSSRYLASLFVIPIATSVVVKNHEKKQVLFMVFSLIQGFAILWFVLGTGFAS